MGKNGQRWLTDQSMCHGKVRPHRVVSSAMAPGIENEEGIATTVYGFVERPLGVCLVGRGPAWIRSRARTSHSVGRGRFPKSPALRLMRMRWGD